MGVMMAPVDASGFDLPGMIATVRQAAPKAAYLLPDFQNPTGLLLDEPLSALDARVRADLRDGFAQSVSGWSENNAERLEHEQESLSWLGYLGSADFWQTTLQNWQSEFLAIVSMALFAIWLRQRGSPESKPVGAAHDATGVEG